MPRQRIEPGDCRRGLERIQAILFSGLADHRESRELFPAMPWIQSIPFSPLSGGPIALADTTRHRHPAGGLFPSILMLVVVLYTSSVTITLWKPKSSTNRQTLLEGLPTRGGISTVSVIVQTQDVRRRVGDDQHEDRGEPAASRMAMTMLYRQAIASRRFRWRGMESTESRASRGKSSALSMVAARPENKIAESALIRGGNRQVQFFAWHAAFSHPPGSISPARFRRARIVRRRANLFESGLCRWPVAAS